MNAITSRVLKHAPSVLIGTGAPSGDARAPVPDVVYNFLPALLTTFVLAPAIRAQREVLLVSALVAASAVMERVGVAYGGKIYSPHQMIVVIGPPGSGKGKVRRVYDLISAVEAALAEQSAAAHAEWEQAGGVESGYPEPPRLSLLISANASARAYFDRLAANGGVALIVTTEIDEYLGTASNDWARLLSPLFRQAFEHEPATIDRVGFTAVVSKPKVALIMAGTPEQAIALLKSAENGMFSRFIILQVERTPGWMSPRPTARSEEEGEAAQSLAILLAGIHGALARRDQDLSVELTPEQWDAVDEVFSTLKAGIGETPDLLGFEASLHRAGVNAVRMATTLAVIRAYETGTDLTGSQVLFTTDDDVEAALTLGVVLLGHALDVYDALPKLPVLIGGNEGAELLFQALPEEFTRAEAVQIAEDAGIASRRTTDKYLKILTDRGGLARGTQGRYQKVKRHRIVI